LISAIAGQQTGSLAARWCRSRELDGEIAPLVDTPLPSRDVMMDLGMLSAPILTS